MITRGPDQPFAPAPELAAYGSCTFDDEGCGVCGEAAIPVRVLALRGPGRARCADRLGQTAVIATAFVGDVRPGDVLLVHAGVALSKVDPHARA